MALRPSWGKGSAFIFTGQTIVQLGPYIYLSMLHSTYKLPPLALPPPPRRVSENPPLELTQASVHVAWDTGIPEAQAQCVGCPGFGVSTLAYSYSNNETDGEVVNGTLSPLPALPGPSIPPLILPYIVPAIHLFIQSSK